MLAEQLKILRKNKKVTQKALADYLNRDQGFISRLEKNLLEPNMSTLVQIANYFECSVDYLLGRESEDGVIILAGGENRPTREIDVIYDKLTILNQGIAIGYLRKLLEEQQEV